jgi:hypothetical protein
MLQKTAFFIVNELQTFQNKFLRIITKLPRVTPIVTLHEQRGTPKKGDISGR